VEGTRTQAKHAARTLAALAAAASGGGTGAGAAADYLADVFEQIMVGWCKLKPVQSVLNVPCFSSLNLNTRRFMVSMSTCTAPSCGSVLRTTVEPCDTFVEPHFLSKTPS